MIKGFFPALFLIVSSCCMMKAKETQGSTLMRPLMTRTEPPSLVLPRVRRLLRLLLHAALQIQNPQGGRNHARLLPGPFTSWKEDGKKRRPGFSINKQGTPAIMLFPAAEPIPSLKHAPGRQPGPGKVSGSPGGEKQAVLTDSLPRSLPGETSNHGAKATY